VCSGCSWELCFAAHCELSKPRDVPVSRHRGGIVVAPAPLGRVVLKHQLCLGSGSHLDMEVVMLSAARVVLLAAFTRFSP